MKFAKGKYAGKNISDVNDYLYLCKCDQYKWPHLTREHLSEIHKKISEILRTQKNQTP